MAIAYDFDGTLAPGNMQEHSFIPQLNLSTKIFWGEVKARAREQDMDEILAYMQLMLEKARGLHLRITKTAIRDHGHGLKFFPGVEEWFKRVNAYAKGKGIKLQHYIISSGLREMVKGTSIAKEFDYVFASGFAYDVNDVAIWPALAVNYTAKTQYLFRINKGVLNSYDNREINKFVLDESRPVPFSRVVYLGDGETDVPCMKMLKYQGGFAIAIYDTNKRKTKNRRSAKDLATELIQQQRADFAAPADYTEGSPLDLLIKSLIDRVAADAAAAVFKKVSGSATTASRRSRHVVATDPPNGIAQNVPPIATIVV